MPTTFQTTYRLCKEQKRQLPDREKLSILGSKIAAHYHEIKFPKRIMRKTISEFGKEFSVLDYHKSFMPEMEKVILEFLEDQPFVPTKKIQPSEINKIL